MSFLSSLLAWGNAPFTIAIGVAVAFAILQMTGLLGLVAGGGDHEGDHDVDAHHDVDADHDHDVEQPGFGQHLLAGLGVGKVPLSIIWQTYAVSFGFAGVAANAVYLGQTGALPTTNLAWALPLSALFGYATTRVLARSLARVLADPKQEATSRKQLVGHVGVVISSKIDGEFGEIRVHDKTGHVVRLVCRTRDAGQSIAEGREAIIVDWDRDADRLYVAPLDDEPRPP